MERSAVRVCDVLSERRASSCPSSLRLSASSSWPLHRRALAPFPSNKGRGAIDCDSHWPPVHNHTTHHFRPSHTMGHIAQASEATEQGRMGHIFQSAKRPAPEMQCSGRGPRWTSQTSCTCAVQRLHGASRCQFVQRHCPSSMHGTNAKALQAREHAVGVTRQKCAVRNASTGQIHNWILVRANTHTHTHNSLVEIGVSCAQCACAIEHPVQVCGRTLRIGEQHCAALDASRLPRRTHH